MAGSSAEHGPRVLAGRFRGRKLRVPRGLVTRPARARVRRSIFDILQQDVVDSRWLDLYAGSGSFGIEALSRGARHVTFVEAGREGADCLQRNLEELSLDEPEFLLLRRRIPAVFQGLAPGGPYDLVSMDPPFAVSREASTLAELCEGLGGAAARGWFAPGTRLIWEEPSHTPAPVPRGFEEVDRRPYGTSRVRFFRFVAPD